MYTKRTIKPMRLLTRALASLALAGIAFTTANAQVLTLDSVLVAVDRNNPMLQEYDDRAKAMDEYAKGARSWMAPMVGAGTFMTPYPNQMLMEEGDKGAVMFSIEQDIPNPAKLKANQRYLGSRADLEKTQRSVQFNALRSEARAYYFQWLVAERKLNVLSRSSRIVSLMLELARIRYPFNQSSLGSIYKAEGRLAEIRNMELMTRASIEENESRLKALMNLGSSDSIAIDTTTVVSFSPEQVVQDTTALLETRSDLKKIEQTISIMKLNQEMQKSQAKPDFRIRFDHMQPIGNMPTQFTAMAMVSIPIAPWSSKMYRSEVKGMQYEITAMQKARRGILVEKKGMIVGMGAQLSRMQQQLENYEKAILPALEKNYRATMLAYEENREQLPAVIDAWEASNMAQLEYLDKQQEYFNMIVSYEKEIEK